MDIKIEEIMLVERNKVGLIIGKGGANIKRIKQQSGAKIILVDRNVEAPYVEITGNKTQVNKAKSLILYI